MIQIFNIILFFAELLSIPIAMLISFRTDNKYVEIGILSYLLFLSSIMTYQLENFQSLI